MNDVVLATAGYDHCIKFWDAFSGACRKSINYPESQINKLAITADKKYLGVAAHNVVKVYDLLSHDNEVSFEGHTGNITSLGFQRENKWFFTSSEDSTLKIFDFRASGYMRNLSNNGIMVNCAVLNPNQVEVVFGDQSGKIKIWDLTTNTTRDLFEDQEEIGIRSLCIANNSSKLVAGNSAGICYIWNSQNGEDFQP